jgi:hypothetical protein
MQRFGDELNDSLGKVTHIPYWAFANFYDIQHRVLIVFLAPLITIKNWVV